MFPFPENAETFGATTLHSQLCNGSIRKLNTRKKKLQQNWKLLHFYWKLKRSSRHQNNKNLVPWQGKKETKHMGTHLCGNLTYQIIERGANIYSLLKQNKMFAMQKQHCDFLHGSDDFSDGDRSEPLAGQQNRPTLLEKCLQSAKNELLSESFYIFIPRKIFWSWQCAMWTPNFEGTRAPVISCWIRNTCPQQCAQMARALSAANQKGCLWFATSLRMMESASVCETTYQVGLFFLVCETEPLDSKW